VLACREAIVDAPYHRAKNGLGGPNTLLVAESNGCTVMTSILEPKQTSSQVWSESQDNGTVVALVFRVKSNEQ